VNRRSGDCEQAIDPSSDHGPVSLRVQYSVPIGRVVHPIKPFLQAKGLVAQDPHRKSEEPAIGTSHRHRMMHETNHVQ